MKKSILLACILCMWIYMYTNESLQEIYKPNTAPLSKLSSKYSSVKGATNCVNYVSSQRVKSLHVPLRALYSLQMAKLLFLPSQIVEKHMNKKEFHFCPFSSQNKLPSCEQLAPTMNSTEASYQNLPFSIECILNFLTPFHPVPLALLIHSCNLK